MIGQPVRHRPGHEHAAAASQATSPSPVRRAYCPSHGDGGLSRRSSEHAGQHTAARLNDNDIPLSARLGGRTPDVVLHEGVPDWLVQPLLDWLKNELQGWSARWIALRLRIAVGDSNESQALRRELHRRSVNPDERWDLLDAVDYLVMMAWDELTIPEFIEDQPVHGTEPLSVLDHLLKVGGSVYHVAIGRRRLERRVSESTETVVQRASDMTEGDSGKFLRSAWEKTYGVHRDPTAAYREAVMAVEAIACSNVIPNDPRPTLGKVIGHFRDAPGNWEVLIPGVDREGMPTGIGALVAMLDLLWTGQTSRHAGTSSSRDQLPIEAEAVLPLAATVVHWFAIGAIRRVT